MSATVTVYNMGGKEVLGRVGLLHAITMLHKGKAKILEAVAGEHFGPYEKPKAVELLRYVFAKWLYSKTGEVPFSKRSVLLRDEYRCCYCGVEGRDKVQTVDHVLPRWQGNSLNYMNAVAACRNCNFKKGGRSPKEADMKMLYLPRVPSFHEAYSWRNNLSQ